MGDPALCPRCQLERQAGLEDDGGSACPHDYHRASCIDHSTCDGMIRSRDQCICAQAGELARLRTRLNNLLAALRDIAAPDSYEQHIYGAATAMRSRAQNALAQEDHRGNGV